MKTFLFHLWLEMDITETKTRKEKIVIVFFGFIFLNEHAAMSGSIKLVCVIMHSHYSSTEVSHLGKENVPVYSPFFLSSPPVSNPIDVLRGLNELEDKKNTV